VKNVLHLLRQLDRSSLPRRSIPLSITIGLTVLGTVLAIAPPARAQSVCVPPSGYGSYATNGNNRNSTWWLNWECYSDVAASTGSGQPFSFTLPDGSKLTTNVQRTGANSVAAQAAPAWTGIATGSIGKGQYDGTIGKTTLYSTASATQNPSFQLSFSSITVTDKSGNPRNFSIWVADGESTDSAPGVYNERLTFTTNGSFWKLIEIIPQQVGTTPPSSSTALNLNNLTATWTAPRPSTDSSLIISTNNPTTVTTASTPVNLNGTGNVGGRQGVIVGMGMPKITLIKSINGRLAINDQFTTAISYISPTVSLATASSSGTSTSFSTGAVSVLPGNIISLSEQMSTGSTSSLNAYSSSIACTNANSTTTVLPAGTIFPTGSAASFSITPQIGDNITCTITNNIARSNISGSIFEDPNYGGGAGRNLATANTSPRKDVIVELYSKSNGAFLATTTTDSTGKYTFSNRMAGDYLVRVVNQSVSSGRPGGCPTPVNTITCTQLPVQTFRTDASSGSVVEDPNRVGGENPSTLDTGAAAAGAVLNTTNYTFTTGASGAIAGGQAESIAPVKVTNQNVNGVDFGYNFDTIVNTRNSGQGSLRQFIDNSNALGNTGLSQVGKVAGVETSIFMIPQAALTNGVAKIAVATGSSLPPITDIFTHLDGRTQTINIGNTNNVVLGSAGPVGIDQLSLNQLNGPEVEIYDVNGGTSANQVGLSIQGDNTTVTGIAIWGFGSDTSASTTDSKGNIIITAGKTNILIDGNVIGTTASSFSDPGANRSGGYGITSQNSSNIATTQTFSNNLIGYNGWGALEIGYASSGIVITGNEIRGNAINSYRADGTAISAGGGLQVARNLFSNNWGPGIDTPGSSGNNLYRNNTVENNGLGASAGQNSGLRLQGSNNIIEKNVIRNNNGSGVLVRNTADFNLITQNSIYSNGAIGIDLIASGGNGDTGTTPFVSSNLVTPTGTNANGLLRFPVLTETTIGGGNLTVKGFAPAGARIELFIADGEINPNPWPNGYSINFGEGKTYLTSVTEGSAADTDSATGSYANDGTGPGTAVTANRFSFSIPLTSLNGQTLSVGTPITATATALNGTATVGGSSLQVGRTSEFSGVVQVTATTAKPGLQLVKRITAIRNGFNANTPGINPNDSTALNGVTADANWPTGYLVGAINGGKVRTGDELEYTIYFVNLSSLPLRRARICDLIKPNQTYVANSLTLAIGNGTPQALSDATDTDGGQLRPANTPLSSADAVFSGCNLPAGNNTNGVVIVDLAGSTNSPLSSIAGFNGVGAANSYGFLRFRAKVN
jgi:uncharacterized repeat protein (TIGR01451 family)